MSFTIDPSPSPFFSLEWSDPIPTLPGVFFATVKSNSLAHRADISFYIPIEASTSLDIPVVIMLHGVYGSHWAWLFKSNICSIMDRMISEKKIPPMVLAMPSDGLFGDGSGYQKLNNKDYEKWIASEVPEVARKFSPIISKKSPLYICGLSMGGYGAMRIGAKYSEIFHAFSGLSSITETSQLSQFVSDYSPFENSSHSVLDAIIENQNTIKPFRFDCGKNDPLFADNLELHHQLASANINHEFHEYQGGHDWDYWQYSIEETLAFFGSTNKPPHYINPNS